MTIQTTPKMKATLHLLIEGDKSDNNYTAYIPELRLGAIGETAEEARENALALVEIEKECLRKNLEVNNELIIDTVEIEL